MLGLLTPVAPEDEERLRPLTRYLRERGRAVSGIELAGAVSMMRLITRMVINATAAYDVVLTPTLAKVPALVGGLRDDADPVADFEAQKALHALHLALQRDRPAGDERAAVAGPRWAARRCRSACSWWAGPTTSAP